MPPEPTAKRADVFIDGQNLFHAVRESFGYTYPNYDVLALADAVCKAQGWTLAQARFYTGIPDPTDNPFWHHFWSAKLAVMGRQGVVVFSRSLRYRNKTVTLPDATELTLPVGEEKGVDIRIALDVIRMAHRGDYDVAVILSQDQDFSEVADEIRVIAQERGRWIRSPRHIRSAPRPETVEASTGPAARCTTAASTVATTAPLANANGTEGRPARCSSGRNVRKMSENQKGYGVASVTP